MTARRHAHSPLAPYRKLIERERDDNVAEISREFGTR